MTEVSTQRVVIVGAGQGGTQVAICLRDNGFTGSIRLISAEHEPPYQRPPLSKGILSGKQAREIAYLRPEAFYGEKNIDLTIGDAVAAIDRTGRTVQLISGAEIGYDILVLATGANPRHLRIPGAELDGVLYLRGLADTDALKARLAESRRIVVIGGGFIGLEAAATAALLGHDVTVLETAGSLMPRVASDVVATFFHSLHHELGATIHLDTTAVEIVGDDSAVSAVRTGDGRELPADIVLVGIGVIPDTALAEVAGLAVDAGIVVDEHLRTSDPAIFAIGDCALFPSTYAGGAHVRLESVQNALDQGKCVADAITGNERAYDAPPWFWTDQGPAKFQIAGLPGPHDEIVVLGDIGSGRFSALLFQEGDLVCVESVNKAIDHISARRLLTVEHGLTADAARADGFELKAYAQSVT